MGYSFLQTELLGVSLGEGKSVSSEEAGSTGALALDFSSACWITGQSPPGLAKSTGDNEKLAGACPHLGSRWWACRHTRDREWKADRQRAAEQRAGAMWPPLGDPRLPGFTGAWPHPPSTPTTSRKFARHMLAPKLGPCSDRVNGLRKEDSGVQFWPCPCPS